MPLKQSGESYTFRPNRTVLDRVIMNQCHSNLVITHRAVDDDIFLVSDHIPLISNIKFQHNVYTMNAEPHIAWNKCSDSDIIRYKTTLETMLHTYNIIDICDTNSSSDDI